MTSRAKKLWDTKSQERLDELEQIHADIRGSGRGRRWYTRQLNLSLFVALVAQFQLYCRNLHDEAVEVYLSHAGSRWSGVLGRLLTQGRKLDWQNPRGSALGSDFGRLGFGIIPALKASGKMAAKDLGSLEILIDFRNAVSHGNDKEVQSLEKEGRIKATLQSYRQYRRMTIRLTDKMDRVVADQIAAQLGISPPW